MHKPDCSSRMIHGYWVYCSADCADCTQRAVQDARTGLLDTVLAETSSTLPWPIRKAVQAAMLDTKEAAPCP